jgi:amino acid transporter
MAKHGIFTGHLGKAHPTNRTPHVAVTVYIGMIFALPAFLAIFTNPLTAFGDAGTLAAFGFLAAYYLVSLAAPMYLKKLGQLERRNIVITVIAVICLAVPTVGCFYPQPPWPVNVFPYIFLGYMAIGAVWLYALSRRQPGILSEIEADLARAPELIDETPVEIPGLVTPEPAMA